MFKSIMNWFVFITMFMFVVCVSSIALFTFVYICQVGVTTAGIGAYLLFLVSNALTYVSILIGYAVVIKTLLD